MKNIFLVTALFILATSCKAQIYPLRTFTEIPTNGYLKDTNNELPEYVGTWKGEWNNKTIFITLKKITNQYNENLKYYKDYLIGKFKVVNSSGQILFDNTTIPDNDAKIWGGKFSKNDNKYSFTYIDEDICGMTGTIKINFTDSSKTQLNWQFSDMTDIITSACPYYNTNPFPEPLPKNIILIKQ